MTTKEELHVTLLFKIKKALSLEHFDDIKFLCKPYLSKAELEPITEFWDLVEKLESRGYEVTWRHGGYSKLVYLFRTANLPNIVELIEECEGKMYEQADELSEANTTNADANHGTGSFLTTTKETTEKHEEPDDISESVVLKLKLHYERHSYVRPVVWNKGFKVALDKTYTTLVIIDRQNRQCREEEVDISKIFHPSYSSTSSPISNYVLIEGNAGTGKTTLSKKMAYTWAQGKGKGENLYGVEKFKMVFLLKARDLTGNLIDDIFNQKLLPEDFSKNRKNVWTLITRNENDVLFIFDGYDELVQENEQLNKLLNGQILRDVSIIVTSRCGHLSKFTNFHTILSNKGFELQQAKEFVKKYTEHYCKTTSKTKLEQRLNYLLKNNKQVQELSSTPLCLVFIIILAEDDEKVVFTTVTQLYQDIVRTLVRRYYAKAGKIISIKNLEEIVKTLSIRLGELAFKGLKAKMVTYKKGEIGDIDNDMVHCGFLVCDESDSLIDPVNIYYFIHKSLQEYFAACKIYYKQLLNLSFLSSVDWSQVLKFVFELSFSKSDLNFIKQIIFDAPVDTISKDTSSNVESMFNIGFSGSCSTTRFRYMPDHYKLSGAFKLCYDMCPQKLFPQMIRLLLEKLPVKIYFNLNAGALQKCDVLINQIDEIESVMCTVHPFIYSNETLLCYLNTLMKSKKMRLVEMYFPKEKDRHHCEQLMINLLGCKSVSLYAVPGTMPNIDWVCHNYLEKIDNKDRLSLVVQLCDPGDLHVRLRTFGEREHDLVVYYKVFFNRYAHFNAPAEGYEESLVKLLKSVKHVEKKEIALLTSQHTNISKLVTALNKILTMCGPLQTFVFVFDLREFRSSYDVLLTQYINTMCQCKEVKKLVLTSSIKLRYDYVTSSSMFAKFEDQFISCLSSDHCWKELNITLSDTRISPETVTNIERICKDKKMNLKLELFPHSDCSSMRKRMEWLHADQLVPHSSFYFILKHEFLSLSR